MFSHLTLGASDLDRAVRFYDATLGTLGQSLHWKLSDIGPVMYAGPDADFPHTFVGPAFDGRPPSPANGFHIAYAAPETTAVDAFHAAALAHGGTDDGAPGLRPHYAEDYYAAYVRDPDGNKIQAVTYLNGRTKGPGGDVISHVTVGYGDLEREAAFYSACLGALGLLRLAAEEEAADVEAAFGTASTRTPVFFVQPTFDGAPPSGGNGPHTAFHAQSREAVHAFHAAALEHGGRCDGPPGPRPQYSERYYAAYVRDAVGNKIQAVCRSAP